MPKLPVISGKEAIKAFMKIGYLPDHQTGSHIILRHKDPPHRRLVIPNHKELNRKTLRKIVNQSGISVDEFVELL